MWLYLTKTCSIHELSQKDLSESSRASKRRFAILKSSIRDATDAITQLNHRLQHATVGEKWWNRVGEFLLQEYPHLYQQLVGLNS